MPENKTSYDVLLLTATKDECDAVLESQSDWQQARDTNDFPYHYRTDEFGFQWALGRASDMGVEYAAHLTTRLVSELSPRCIAMVGVCAGDRAKVSLGDVIVADRLYRYDSGKLRATISGADISEELLLDIRTYNVNEHWRRELEDHDFGPWSESLVNSRPRSLKHQRYWLLSKLLEHQDGRSPHPRELSERDIHCPDWSIVFDQLNNAGEVVNDRGMQITELGRRELETYRNRYPGGLPAEKLAPTVWVGTMATGSKVVEDERLFPTLQKVVRKTIAVDMEASAIAAVANLENGLPFLVIKGVQDYAAPKKDDRFRKYAAEAAFRFAETALRHLLREPRTPLGKVSAHSFTFTNVDQVLSRIYRVRRVLISNEESMDFSERSKVQFELWEVKIARNEHILVLGEDVVLGQTIDRFLEMTQQKGINIEDLTVIQVKQRARSSTPKQISDRLKGIRHRFFPIREYIRQFCLPAELSRQEEAFEEPFYIDQPIYERETGGQPLNVDGGHSGTPADEDAIRVLKSRITSLHSSCAHMIFANGGDGKSSLCAKLVNAINSDPTYDRLAILLRVEDISEKLVRESESAKRIDSVFDVYNLFAVLSGRVPPLNEDDFDVSVLSGNLVLVVDGLDELYTLLHETFDRRSFLQSLSALNSQLGEASVVLTSRANIFEDLEEHFADISVSFLLGFNEARCNKYFEKRFKERQDGFDLQQECMRDVRRLLEISESERISPYIVDLIAKLHVDERDIGTNRMGEKRKLQWLGPRDLYPNNGGLTDKVVFHVLNREIVRQSTELSVTDMIDLFCEIAAEHGTSISLVKLRETVTEYYDRKADSVFEVLRLNPLIRIQNDAMRFRYHFLYSYFLTLFSLASLNKTEAVASPPISSTFAKLAEGEGAIYRDVQHYVKSQNLSETLRKSVKKLRAAHAAGGGKQLERAISFFVHLLVDFRGQGDSRTELSTYLFSFFADDNGSVSRLFIHGSLAPLDFSERSFSHCGFFDFKEFYKSDFGGSHFSSTVVELVCPVTTPSSISPETFDQTCRLAGLKGFVSIEASAREVTLRRFFAQLRPGGQFSAVSIADLRIGRNVSGDLARFVREAQNQHVVFVSADGTRIGVTDAGKKLVSDFLGNNTLDRKLFKIMEAIEDQ